MRAGVETEDIAYQGKIADKISDLLVFPLVNSRLDDAHRHWLLDNIVVVRDEALVDAAMEKSRGVITTTTAQLAA